MREVTDLIAIDVKLICPYCGEQEEGFYGDPRGDEFECEECGKTYKIHPDADIEYL